MKAWTRIRLSIWLGSAFVFMGCALHPDLDRGHYHRESGEWIETTALEKPDGSSNASSDQADSGMASPRAFLQTGVVSFYGAKFHGRKTASGEKHSAKEMVAAHRTLPFGTRVKVTHLGTGASVVVRINDRGPFHSERVLDVSRTAARKLGLMGSGKSLCRVETVIQ